LVIPLASPVTIVECDIPPVVENVFGRLEYAVFAVVPYLQVAAISVSNDIVVCVVPAAREPAGKPFDATGSFDGMESVVVDTVELCALSFKTTSYARTEYEYRVPELSPVSEYEVPDVVATGDPPPLRYIEYPSTPLAGDPGSIDASHERLTWEVVTAVTTRFVGTEGGVSSPQSPPLHTVIRRLKFEVAAPRA
jgi:hypothetical protein